MMESWNWAERRVCSDFTLSKARPVNLWKASTFPAQDTALSEPHSGPWPFSTEVLPAVCEWLAWTWCQWFCLWIHVPPPSKKRFTHSLSSYLLTKYSKPSGKFQGMYTQLSLAPQLSQELPLFRVCHRPHFPEINLNVINWSITIPTLLLSEEVTLPLIAVWILPIPTLCSLCIRGHVWMGVWEMYVHVKCVCVQNVCEMCVWNVCVQNICVKCVCMKCLCVKCVCSEFCVTEPSEMTCAPFFLHCITDWKQLLLDERCAGAPHCTHTLCIII